MPPSSLTHTLRRLWALDKFAYSLRVFIALAGALLLCWWQDRIELLIPLFLGIIASALAEHKRVFIDVTADWCVTCKANKYNVLLRDDVQQALLAPDVIALRGDWSRQIGRAHV